jgi:hypothetical protein
VTQTVLQEKGQFCTDAFSITRRFIMRAILLASILMFVSQALYGDAPENPIYTSHVVSVCSEYTFVDPEAEDDDVELQRVCLQVTTRPGEGFTAFIRRECMIGVGVCPAGPFGWIRSQCYLERENGSGIVMVGNKNQFEVDIQPEDCDFSFGEPMLGAQLIAKTNGEHEVTYLFERWESRYSLGNQQCWSILGGGNTEERSADIVATIDGRDIFVADYIRTYKVEREDNHCSH